MPKAIPCHNKPIGTRKCLSEGPRTRPRSRGCETTTKGSVAFAISARSRFLISCGRRAIEIGRNIGEEPFQERLIGAYAGSRAAPRRVLSAPRVSGNFHAGDCLGNSSGLAAASFRFAAGTDAS
jgi:hypothetical protein